jgi:hypothetical protein
VIERELEQLKGEVRCDPFFTARVLDALPEPLRFTGLSPRERVAVLAIFHVLALVAAYGILRWAAPDAVDAVADGAHAWFGLGLDVSAPWLTAFALVAVALVAFISSRSHTRPT